MQSACRRRVLLMNMFVPEACDVDSREKWDVTPSNKCFLSFFCDFLTKKLVYEKLNPYICRCVMEYHLGGCRKTYLLLGGTMRAK